MHYMYIDIAHKDLHILCLIPNDITDSYWFHTHNSFAYNPEYAIAKFTHCLSKGGKATLRGTNKITSTTAALKIMFKRWEW